MHGTHNASVTTHLHIEGNTYVSTRDFLKAVNNAMQLCTFKSVVSHLLHTYYVWILGVAFIIHSYIRTYI